jgi:hypothetical protein
MVTGTSGNVLRPLVRSCRHGCRFNARLLAAVENVIYTSAAVVAIGALLVQAELSRRCVVPVDKTNTALRQQAAEKEGSDFRVGS